MQITQNTTNCLAECFAFSDKEGQRQCVVVLKGSFDVGQDGTCEWAAEPPKWVYADEHHGDPGTTCLRHEHDFAPVKPRIDILVNGAAVAPDGRMIETMQVALEGPGLCKVAQVTGNRVWDNGMRGPRPTAPEPFSTIPLVWHRAFGGSDLSHESPARHGTEVRNPVGLGFHLNEDITTILGQALPNIEDPATLLHKWSDKANPIGFGSVGRSWTPRLQHGGTYDAQWIKETMPFLPHDFDTRYFLSAPPDQQLDALPPDSLFTCHNMSEDRRFVVRIPVFSIPVRFFFADHAESHTITPDTVILEPQTRRLTLLGRTHVRLPRKMTALREIKVGQSFRTRNPATPHYRDLAQAIAALKGRR